jgi:hypothetical protein
MSPQLILSPSPRYGRRHPVQAGQDHDGSHRQYAAEAQERGGRTLFADQAATPQKVPAASDLSWTPEKIE